MPAAGAVMLWCQLQKVKKDPQSIYSEFMTVGHSLWSHAAKVI